jgi:HlyD family secretion protein
MNEHPTLSHLHRAPRGPDRPARRIGAALFLLALAAGFGALAWLWFGDRLRPAPEVRVAPVLLLPADTADAGPDAPASAVDAPAAGALLFQASGWIEPDPHPLRVSVKTDGFVETVHALEGEAVRAGQLLATLDDADARLADARAAADAAEAEAALSAHLAGLPAAEARIAQAAAAGEAASARAAEAEDRFARLARLEPGDTSADERNAARRAREERRADQRAAAAEVERTRRELDRLRAETTGYESAAAGARARRAEAALALERTRIHAPADGVVLRRYAAPGLKRMVAGEDMESATLFHLFDPARLQARVDVPLSEAGRVVPGQFVRVITSIFPDRAFTARVTRVTGEADYQRNTLQIKAALLDPDPRLRPEMLCRAEFYGAPADASGAGTPRAATHRLWIDEAALGVLEGDRATVWIVDPVRRTAAPRVLRLGPDRRDRLRLVLDGARENERAILTPPDTLTPGGRVRPVFPEDPS